jgi:hypothetical protein
MVPKIPLSKRKLRFGSAKTAIGEIAVHAHPLLRGFYKKQK